jgi:hypothetical protein
MLRHFVRTTQAGARPRPIPDEATAIAASALRVRTMANEAAASQAVGDFFVSMEPTPGVNGAQPEGRGSSESVRGTLRISRGTHCQHIARSRPRPPSCGAIPTGVACISDRVPGHAALYPGHPFPTRRSVDDPPGCGGTVVPEPTTKRSQFSWSNMLLGLGLRQMRTWVHQTVSPTGGFTTNAHVGQGCGGADSRPRHPPATVERIPGTDCETKPNSRTEHEIQFGLASKPI